MVATLPSAKQICSDVGFSFKTSKEVDLGACVLGPINGLVGAYAGVVKSELELMLSDAASRKAREVIDEITYLYDELYLTAQAGGANSGMLKSINRFIENGMTSLVHDFSGYIDDEIKEIRTFVDLFKFRRNEAIWCEIFTFYFSFSRLNAAPSELAAEFVRKFWECFLLTQDKMRQHSEEPYYAQRILKIFYESVFHRYQDEKRSYRNPDFVALFERYTSTIMRSSSEEFAKKIKIYLGALAFEI